MKLYLVRHGVAEVEAENDAVRRLTISGARKVVKAAQGFATLDEPVGHLVSSPLVRARETAELFAKVLNVKAPVSLSEALKPDAAPDRAQKVLFASERWKTIMLVGHMPHLSRLASFLLTGNETLNVDFGKSGMMCLAIDAPFAAGTATLVWLLRPNHLRSMQ